MAYVQLPDGTVVYVPDNPTGEGAQVVSAPGGSGQNPIGYPTTAQAPQPWGVSYNPVNSNPVDPYSIYQPGIYNPVANTTDYGDYEKAKQALYPNPTSPYTSPTQPSVSWNDPTKRPSPTAVWDIVSKDPITGQPTYGWIDMSGNPTTATQPKSSLLTPEEEAQQIRMWKSTTGYQDPAELEYKNAQLKIEQAYKQGLITNEQARQYSADLERAWNQTYQQQQLDWTKQYQTQQLGQNQQQLDWTKNYQQQQLDQQNKAYAANLAANPVNWLEYDKYQGNPSVVQPWMNPMLSNYNANAQQPSGGEPGMGFGFPPEQANLTPIQSTGVESGMGFGFNPEQVNLTPTQAPINNEKGMGFSLAPDGNDQLSQWTNTVNAYTNPTQPTTPSAPPATTNQLTTGSVIPGSTGTDLSQMPELMRPSAQTFSGMNPSAQGQYYGYQRAQAGMTPSDTQYWLNKYSAPGGQYGGLSYRR